MAVPTSELTEWEERSFAWEFRSGCGRTVENLHLERRPGPFKMKTDRPPSSRDNTSRSPSNWCPCTLFGWEGSPTKIDCRKKWYPYSHLSTGGPRHPFGFDRNLICFPLRAARHGGWHGAARATGSSSLAKTKQTLNQTPLYPTAGLPLAEQAPVRG